MGMDLKPIKPSRKAPRYPKDDNWFPNQPIWGRYNWSGWEALATFLKRHDPTLVSYMAGSNDGAVIPEEICIKIANVIEAYWQEEIDLETGDKMWAEVLRNSGLRWRTCGGYEQW